MHSPLLSDLPSVCTLDQVQTLHDLGIHTIRDLAEFDACRHAEFVMSCVGNGKAETYGLEHYLDPDVLEDDLRSGWTSFRSHR